MTSYNASPGNAGGRKCQQISFNYTRRSKLLIRLKLGHAFFDRNFLPEKYSTVPCCNLLTCRCACYGNYIIMLVCLTLLLWFHNSKVNKQRIMKPTDLILHDNSWHTVVLDIKSKVHMKIITTKSSVTKRLQPFLIILTILHKKSSRFKVTCSFEGQKVQHAISQG